MYAPVQTSKLVHLAASGIAHIGPCFLLSVAASSTAKDKILSLYAGLNTSAEKLLLFNMAEDGNFERRFARPILCEQGVYVDLTDTAITADVEILPAFKGTPPA